jgi:hypothetical protein
VIAICGIGPVNFSLSDPSKPAWREVRRNRCAAASASDGQMIRSKGLWQKFAECELRSHAFRAGDVDQGRRVGEFADALAAAAARRA